MSLIPKAPSDWYRDLIPILEDIYKTEIYIDQYFNNNVELLTEELCLYMRVMPKMWLTIALINVGEERQRKGIGTKILSWCKEYCTRNDIPCLKIESALTAEMQNFCIKHGFKQTNQIEMCSDWVLTL